MRTTLLGLALLSCSTRAPTDAGADASEDAEPDAGIVLPCDPSGLSKGPWSLAMTETGITVRWETCRAGTPSGVFFAPEPMKPGTRASSVEKPFDVTMTHKAPLNPSAPPDHAGRWYLHEARIEGLQPGTCHRYELEIDRAAAGRFCTSYPPGASFRFMAIGDTNPMIGTITRDVLARTIPKNPAFVVHGGDVQYYDSTLETWASWFPVMAPMLRQGAFTFATGNHEYEKPTEYAEYVQRFFGGAGEGNDHYYRVHSGGVWFFFLDTEESLDLTSPQGQWLVASLADAKGKPGHRFSVVTVHRPFVTCGDSGDHPAWLSAYGAAFDQYGVSLVIQAHMHGYERFEIGQRTFVTTAGGGGILGNVDENVARTYCSQRVRSGAFHHAVIFDVSPGKLAGEVITEQGQVVDQFEKIVP